MRLVLSFLASIVILTSCQKEQLPSCNIISNNSIGWNKKSNCTLVYTDQSHSVSLSGKIKYRGGISSRYEKHSYAIELDKPYPLGGLPAEDDWIINASYIDKTFMRHKISFDLYNTMHSNNIAPNCAYLSVCENGSYEGLYVLMSEINGSFLNLSKSDSLSMLFKDPPLFYEEQLKNVQDSSNYFQQKYPKKKKADKTWYITQFQNFIFNSNDSTFNNEIAKWVDIDNVIDWHLMLLFSNNNDGIMKNFYLYKLNSNTPFRFAIWDYDHSYGRDGDNELNLIRKEADCKKSILLRRLMENNSFDYNQQLSQRWKDLRSRKIFSKITFHSMVDANMKAIYNELETQFERWPVDSKWYYDSNDFEQELEILQNYSILRINQLDKRFGYNADLE